MVQGSMYINQNKPETSQTILEKEVLFYFRKLKWILGTAGAILGYHI